MRSAAVSRRPAGGILAMPTATGGVAACSASSGGAHTAGAVKRWPPPLAIEGTHLS